LNFWAKVETTQRVNFFSLDFDGVSSLRVTAAPAINFDILNFYDAPDGFTSYDLFLANSGTDFKWAFVSCRFSNDDATGINTADLVINLLGVTYTNSNVLAFESLSLSFCDQESSSGFCDV
jgi:hypothetical protein